MYERGDPAPGGCRETLLLTWIVFQILAPALFGVVAVIVLVTMLFALMAQHPLLALIPIGITAGSFYGLYRWEKNRAQKLDDLEAEHRRRGGL